MQPVSDLDELHSTQDGGTGGAGDPGSVAPAFVRVAVLCRMPHQGPQWGSAAADALAGQLVHDCLTHFDYFPVDFTDPQAGDRIAAVFAEIDATLDGTVLPAGPDTGPVISADPLQRTQPFDAIAIVGGHDIDSDIALIHRVLAPGMQAARVPVLCALGADDGKTILGDCAWQVQPDPQALIEAIAAAVRPAGASPEAICEQIRSLGEFLVTERAIEARILRDAALLPALRKQFARHEAAVDASAQLAARTVEQVQLRLLREAGQLEQSRAKIGVELSRAQERSKRRKATGLGLLRVGVLAVFICLTVALWLLTSPASTVFFGGCALVLLSAAYVGIGNRITDQATDFTRRERA